MRKKHLDFYNKCIENGNRMPKEGLCVNHSLISMELLELFEPTEEDFRGLIKEKRCTVYWASGMHEADISQELFTCFTPLRQTIILFMAAIANEFD